MFYFIIFKMLSAMWWFYFSKAIDLFDTVSKHFIIAMLNPFNFNDHKMLKIYLIIIIDVSITIIDKTINIIY